MADIVSLGELLVDFTYMDMGGGVQGYKRNAGGAPANVAVMASRLGASSGFIGKIGRDMFGFYLKSVLVENKVDISGLILDPNYSTTLAFVKRNDDGDRDFMFYRSSQISADLNLRYGEVNRNMIDECKVFHFSALSLTAEPSRTASLNAAEYAKLQGKLVSFDPNWRPHLWQNKESALLATKSALQYADIIRVSEEELGLITDCGTLVASVAKLFKIGIKVILVTQGAKGCIIATAKGIERYPSYKTKIVDTLGAGDSFLGAFLYSLIKSGKDISELDSDDIREMAMFSNACGALSSSKEGAIPAMPDLKEVQEFMKTTLPDEPQK